MSDEASDTLMFVLMCIELYVAMASMVTLFVKQEDYRLYPLPLWSTRRYCTVLICFWPLLVLAVPYLRYKNRHLSKADVDNTLKAIRLAKYQAMELKHFGIDPNK